MNGTTSHGWDAAGSMHTRDDAYASGATGSQRLSSALLDTPVKDRADGTSNEYNGGRKGEGFADGSSPATRGHWNAASGDADHTYFPRGDVNFARRQGRTSEEPRRPLRGDATWKDAPVKPLAGRGTGRTWRPSAADEADRWKPAGGGEAPIAGWKHDAKVDAAFSHTPDATHNNSFATGRQGFSNGRGGKPLAARHMNGAPGSQGPPGFGGGGAQQRAYNRQDLFAVRSDMLTKGGSQLPLPSSASKEARETPEIWRPAAGGRSSSGAAAGKAVPPPPGLVGPYERRLAKLEKQAAELELAAPFSKIDGGQFWYFDHSGHLQGPFPAEHIKAWGDHGQLPDDLLCSVNADGARAFQFRHLAAVHRLIDAEAIAADEVRDLAKREAAAPPTAHLIVTPPAVLGSSALLAAEGPAAAPSEQRSTLTTSHVADAARWGGGDGVDVVGWVGTIGQPVGGGGSASHGGWPSQGADAAVAPDPDPVAPDHDPLNDIIGGLTSAVITPEPSAPAGAAVASHAARPKDDPWDPVSAADPTFPFGGAAPWDSRAHAAPAPHSDALAHAPPAASPSPPLPAPQPPAPPAARDREAPPLEADAQSYLTGLGVVLGKQSPAKPVAPQAQPVWAPPAPAPQQQPPPPPSSGPAPWAAQAPAEPPHGASLQDIQREAMREREAASALAAARAAAEPPARKPMWAPPAIGGAQPSLDAIMDDEENAADLEGGACLDDGDAHHHHQAHGGALYGAPAGWNGAAQARGAQPGLFDTGASQVASQPPPPPPRAAGSVPAWNQRAGGVAAPAAPTRRPPTASTQAPPQPAQQQRQHAQYVAATPPHAAAPAEPEDDEHPLLKKSPKFRAWCVEQMRVREGSLTLVSQLLSLSTPGEMNEMAQICLKSEGVGTFVTQFWKMKVEAESAAAKAPAAGKKKKRQSLAPGEAQRTAGGAAQRLAPTAPRAAPPAAAEDDAGWQAAGVGGKAKGGRGATGKRGGGGGGGGKGGPQMGGAFALLPSY